MLFLANAHSSGSPNPVDLFVVGIAGVRPPLRLTPPAGSLVVSFELDPFGLYALYRDKYQSELFYVATDASRPARRVDLDPGPCSGVTRAGFTADDRFALYLDEGECDVVELYSFPLPRHLRGSDPPAAF